MFAHIGSILRRGASDDSSLSLAAPTLAFARAGSCGGWVAGSEAGHGEIWYNGWAAAIERVSDTNSHGDGVVGPTL